MNQRDYNLPIRKATAEDRSGVIELISQVYREYGDQVLLEGAESDLLEIPDYYRRQGGDFWILCDRENKVMGTHATYEIDRSAAICGFRRLYLSRHLRGQGYGKQLMQVTIDWAWAQDFRRIEFWSDTRFDRAHTFFEGFGFTRDGRQRTMHDGFATYHEYFFFLNRPTNQAVSEPSIK